MKPKGYKKMEMAEKKMKEERLRRMIRQEVRAALKGAKPVKKAAKK